MWPLPKVSNESITCICTPQAISLSHLQPKKGKVFLNAYQRIAFSNAELEYSLVCNPTRIRNIIGEFSEQYSPNAPVSIAVSGPSVHEKITTTNTKANNTRSIATYLYTHNQAAVYYTTYISPALLMQYQLMAITKKINVPVITTPFLAQLTLYQTVHDSAFRHTQLAQDLRTNNHRIEHCFTQDIIPRLATISSALTFDLANERDFLLSSLGLFYTRR